ncbi:arsenate reductase/protein-tyrosine-phosphatase family protein [Sphaerisporangium aureirubrum]|uniref:ArsR family transcriptional regulator n=1 Tax=Sphaerisporangium aureirubrum TaxID=1544736 RepID=A0ABW1NM60_9ACTN
MMPPVRTAPAFVRMAAHPLRWRMMTELAVSDYRVRELVELLGQPQNLVSYHLRLLRGSGLVTARRSSFDARDHYHHLDLERCADALAGAGAALHPGLRLDLTPPPAAIAESPARSSVLFACTGNSARSPIAEALLRHRAGGRVEVASAGSHPAPRTHPNAVRALREHYGIDIAGRRPRHLDTVARHRFDHRISLCDRVREVRPEFGDRPRPIHWSIADPAATDDVDQFRHLAAEIDTRIRYLLPVLTHATKPEAQP